MASTSEVEDETEEILLFAEIDGLLCTEILEHDSICVPTFKLVGLDTDKPYMQIGKETFEGEYQDRTGSALFFEKDPHPIIGDTTFRRVPENILRYFGKTDKNLYMNRVFLKSKTEPECKEVIQPTYIDSKDLEALAASEKEYLDMIDNFQETNMAAETTSDVIEIGLVKENAQHCEIAQEEAPLAETLHNLADGPSCGTESNVVLSETSGVAEVSQLICEQMDIDSNLHEPAT